MRTSLLTTLLAGLLASLAPLSAASAGSAPPERVPVLVVGGANNHDWSWTTPAIAEILEESGKFDVAVTEKPAETLADPETYRKYRALVLDYNGPRWGEAAEKLFVEAVEGGMGVVVVHAADNAFEGWKPYEEMCALMWREGTGHGRFHSFDVKVVDRDHPITRDLPDLIAHPDELYHKLVHMHDTDYRVLLTAYSDPETGGTGADEPMVIVKEYGKGRIFHDVLGHVWAGSEGNRASFWDPQFRDLMVRGTEWAATGDVTGPVVVNTVTDAEAKMGWTNLFDGKSTEHWRRYRSEDFPEKGWVIEDGALRVVAGGGGGDLVTREPYRDFEFAFDFKVSKGANSGVMFRVTEDHGAPWETGPEYQILDDSNGGNPLTASGALYALYPADPIVTRPPGEWNHGKIVVVGNHLEHWLNGRLLVDVSMDDPEYVKRVAESKFGAMPDFGIRPTGHLCLQDHGHDVWFRNLKVRSLDPNPDTEVALFDGKDLAGWTYFLQDGGKMEDVWSVTDEGVLVCKGQPIGYLRTKADYDNFFLRVQWRFDPVTKRAGNSGVLLRMIGEDEVWPRSIEAQLQSGAAGDFWNIGVFPMKVVAERTNGRNTARTATNEKALGEWNTYEITCWHGHCVLRVNGQILNRAWDCLEVPGKICLQSEGAEIHFRDIALTPLR